MLLEVSKAGSYFGNYRKRKLPAITQRKLGNDIFDNLAIAYDVDWPVPRGN